MREPDQRPVFNRRHFGTPETITLIVTNYITVALGLMIFVNSHHHIHWFFWIVLGVLAAYNVFSIYRYREEYNKMAIISYIVATAGLGLLFLMV